MEANEAPEKLYLLSNGLISYCRNTDEDVEYTNTDAFIERACNWFRRIDYDDSIPPFETTEEFIRVFKKVMKGE